MAIYSLDLAATFTIREKVGYITFLGVEKCAKDAHRFTFKITF